MNGTQARQLPHRNDFNKALRKALKVKYPSIKFSVRGSTGTAYGYIHITWEGRLTRDDLREFLMPWDVQDSDVITDYAGSGYKLCY